MSVDYFEKIFQKHDDNNSGTLSKVEFQECFKELGLNWTGEMEEIYEEFDEDNSGEVAYDGEILPYLVQSVSNFLSHLHFVAAGFVPHAIIPYGICHDLSYIGICP